RHALFEIGSAPLSEKLSQIRPRRSTAISPLRKAWFLFRYCRVRSSSEREFVLFAYAVILLRSTRPVINSTGDGIWLWSNLPSPGMFQLIGRSAVMVFTSESVQAPSMSA